MTTVIEQDLAICECVAPGLLWMLENLQSMSLSDFIRKKRMGAFLTQQEAAKLLGYARSQFLSNLERGNRKPPLEVLKRMCEIYKVPEEEMRSEYVKQVTHDAQESASQRWDETPTLNPKKSK